MDQGGAASLFRLAREKKVLTFADMTADAYGIGPEGIASVYPYTDYLMPSYEEALYTCGKEDVDDIADYFLTRGVQNVVLKLGSDGCFVKNSGDRFYMDPYPVRAVDTTGCGDNSVSYTHLDVYKRQSLTSSSWMSPPGASISAPRPRSIRSWIPWRNGGNPSS